MIKKYKVRREKGKLIFERLTHPRLMAVVDCTSPVYVIEQIKFYEKGTLAEANKTVEEIGHYLKTLSKWNLKKRNDVMPMLFWVNKIKSRSLKFDMQVLSN